MQHPVCVSSQQHLDVVACGVKQTSKGCCFEMELENHACTCNIVQQVCADINRYRENLDVVQHGVTISECGGIQTHTQLVYVTDVKLIVHPALVYTLHNMAAVGLHRARQASGRKQHINSCQQQRNS